MKNKILLGLGLAVVMVISLALPVVAAVDEIVNIVATSGNSTIYFSWTRPSTANLTIIRYRTDTFPTSVTDGSVAYNGTAQSIVIENLDSGQTYYYKFWGYKDADHSPLGAEYSVTTLYKSIVTGAEGAPEMTVPTPTMSNMNEAPDTSSLNLEPFTSIIGYFNGQGIGMPTNNAWETIYAIIVVLIGLAVYGKTKEFFSAFVSVFILTIAGCAITLLQWYLVPVEMTIGGGIWAINYYLQ